MKVWHDLSDEEKYIVDRLPFFADVPREQRKKHRFCTRCWYEETSERSDLA